MKIVFLIILGNLFINMLLTVLGKTYRVAGLTFGEGGGGGGSIKGEIAPQPQYIPAPPTPTVNTAEVEAAKIAEQQRRLKAVGVSSTNVTHGSLGDVSASTAKPTLLGGN